MNPTRSKAFEPVRGILAILARRWMHLGLMVIAGWFFRHAINPDGIAYIQVARHWIGGNHELAITGYWGPLFSWILVPFFWAGIPALVTARLVMILTTLFFLESARNILESSTVSSLGRRVIDGCLVCASILWSVENITPDILLAGIYLRILHSLMENRWAFSASHSVKLGCWLGLAYLTKSVALPVTLLLFTLCLAARKFVWRGRLLPSRKCLGVTLGIWGGLALIWISVLSIHYGQFTFSTSARIVHATVGPGDVQRYPNGFKIEKPEPGRITHWEDPSLEEHQFWSPFDSRANLKHQISVTLSNIIPALIIHSSLFFLFIPLILMCLVIIRSRVVSRRNRYLSPGLWRGSVILLFILAGAGIYLPTLLPITEQRYFYAVAPLCAVLSMEWMKIRYFLDKRHLLIILVAFSLCFPAVARWAVLPSVSISAFEQAHTAAEFIRSHPSLEPGNVVGNARLRRGRAGLYLAFFLNTQWFGGDPRASISDHMDSGAELLALAYDDPRISEAQSNPDLSPLEIPGAEWLKLFTIRQMSKPHEKSD